ncbi:MAG: hypothetical protein IPK02_21930 [Candidatus Accumulibacter sp.]|uniref:Uncharacterized protein n=1 Tax=Candidatus Accumulibacter affinis TaxID=2954384 RepID=A0A935TB52_9PROT|nr:hypothetical protein [Candidatus Accumulibacter affinis]
MTKSLAELSARSSDDPLPSVLNAQGITFSRNPTASGASGASGAVDERGVTIIPAAASAAAAPAK